MPLTNQRAEVFHPELMCLLRCLVLFQTAEQAYVYAGHEVFPKRSL